MTSQLSLFAGDSLASHIVTPGSEKARAMTVRSGRKCIESYAKYSPLGSLLRTLLASSHWNSTACFLTWKVEATPAKRLLFRLQESEPSTDEHVSGSLPTILPTPTAAQLGNTPENYIAMKQNMASGPRYTVTDLNVWVQMYPTPDANCWKGGGEGQRRRQLNGKLNPQWVEWLMGYPEGWTDLER